MLLDLDSYAQPLPTFNIGGASEVRTHCGGCISLIILLVVFLFATLKMQHLLSNHNPQVNTFLERDAFDESHIWKAEQDDDFMVAFTVTHFIDGTVKDDPNFVKWFVTYVI